jgi:hypothetical protein
MVAHRPRSIGVVCRLDDVEAVGHLRGVVEPSLRTRVHVPGVGVVERDRCGLVDLTAVVGIAPEVGGGLLHDALDGDVVSRAAIKDVGTGTADQDVVPGSAQEGVVAGTADQNVVAIAAVENEPRPVAAEPRGIDHIVTPQSGDADSVVGVEVIDHDLAGKAIDHQRTVHDRQRDDIVAGGAVDSDGVVLTVASGAADRPSQVDVDASHVGAGEVIDRDGVGSAESMDVHGLDPLRVHRDGADIAEQHGVRAVR